MAQSTRPPRQTRSSAACDSCRSKKQKCGGEWPTCARCRETGNECIWPPQLQRGPAKGYLEAIEARLDEVEHILLQLVPLVPADQLLNTTCQTPSPASVESSPKRTTQEKRAALDHWTAFPLNSPQALLAWCQDRQRRAHHPGARASTDLSSTPADHPSSTPRTTAQLTDAAVDDVNRRQQDANGGILSDWPIQQMPYGRPDPRPASALDGAPHTPDQPAGQTAPSIQHSMQGTPSISSSVTGDRIDLSDEFQSKFLW